MKAGTAKGLPAVLLESGWSRASLRRLSTERSVRCVTCLEPPVPIRQELLESMRRGQDGPWAACLAYQQQDQTRGRACAVLPVTCS